MVTHSRVLQSFSASGVLESKEQIIGALNGGGELVNATYFQNCEMVSYSVEDGISRDFKTETKILLPDSEEKLTPSEMKTLGMPS